MTINRYQLAFLLILAVLIGYALCSLADYHYKKELVQQVYDLQKNCVYINKTGWIF